MPSFIAWVDYSSTERQRMRQAVALFEEKDTRDELGIGSIRDAFADELFPGTSVIQTRLRYILLVPWLYARLENDRRVNSANVEQCMRADELKLITVLLATHDTLGVIGKRSGDTLQRAPSSIYWLALQRWEVFRHRWTIDEYHRRWDRLRSARHGQMRADDRGVGPDPVLTWHPELPPRHRTSSAARASLCAGKRRSSSGIGLRCHAPARFWRTARRPRGVRGSWRTNPGSSSWSCHMHWAGR